MRLSCFIACLLVACGVSNEQHLVGDGTFVRFSADPFALEISGRDGRVLRTPRLLMTRDRPEYVGQLLVGWDGYRAHEAEWTGVNTGYMYLGSRKKAQAVFELEQHDKTPVSLTVEVGADRVTLSYEVNDPKWDKIGLEFPIDDDEHFFGMGERFASVDHRGLSLYSWAEEGGLGAGENAVYDRGTYPFPNGASMTYFPVPFVHSTGGYSLLANTTRRTEMRIDSERAQKMLVAVDGRKLDVVIYTQRTPAARLDDYTNDTGRPFVPAPWVWGVRMRSDAARMVGPDFEYQLMRQKHLPVTAIDDTSHFLPDNSHYGREMQLQQNNDTLHRWGYRTVAYNTPYVAASDPDAADIYRYGLDHDLFVKGPDGVPEETFFISGQANTMVTIDLTNPDGFAWYQALLQRTLDLGYHGWMNDFGEYIQRDAAMFDGRAGAEAHNIFGLLSAMAAHELLEQKLPNDNWFFVRSGYIGTQQYVPQVWGGDSEATFDDSQGLPSAVRAGLNLGLVGVMQYGSDTTGFKCTTPDPNDKEVYIRWLEFAAVSPIFHYEDACANPIMHKTKWNLWNDEETQDAWRMTASLHTRLAPYLRAAAVEAHATGMPIMRHPLLTHPNEQDGWKVEDSYFFGPSLYAAPVVRRGLTQRSVWLPPGRYVELTDRTVHMGPGTITTPAPLMRLPLFLAENTLVPMLDADVQTLVHADEPSVVSEENRADLLDVIAALAEDGSAQMTLADGTQIQLQRMDSAAPAYGAVGTDVHDCEACSVPSDRSGDAGRARFTSAKAASFAIQHEEIAATVTGSIARRYRFEVLRL
jgi:alpha-glucosidase (family GH31 glycosyl hydrolase)